MFRQFDFECTGCGRQHGDLVQVPAGRDAVKRYRLDCPHCGARNIQHRRVVSKPARYLYDRPFAPEVYGGKFDTQGFRKLPPLMPLPDDAPFDQARDLFSSREYQDRRKERHAQLVENETKKARAQAMKVDKNMDLRTHPLPGDPPVESVGKRRKKVSKAS